MQRELQLAVPPEAGFDSDNLQRYLRKHLSIGEDQKLHVILRRRSIDARGRQLKVNITATVWIDETPQAVIPEHPEYPDVQGKPEVVVIGAGPAGLFAALRLIEKGLKPIILERGKDVRARRRDLAAINREHVVNPDSNYCFGEGGAGTYSDGKLYTRSNKRGDIAGVLNTFFAHGAVEEILVDTHPHIGTNKLPSIIVSMRETILRCGGEVHFNSRVEDFDIQSGKLCGVKIAGGINISCTSAILATGHSARDIYEILHRKQILLEFKPFALGVRAEHPQQLIDQIQYHCDSRGIYLPPASYSLVNQVDSRGVYSFCMCPGGIVAPCATSPGEIVTNGWSPSKRNNPFANSGIVVEIKPEDLKTFEHRGPLAGMDFQRSIEQTAWLAGGKTQVAPAQRMVDFVQRKISSSLPESSYQPGINSVNLHEVLPKTVAGRLAKAFVSFGDKMRGYYTNEAVLHAVESRTSTPVRIPRDQDTLMHTEIAGLFPCGEGAGYAGGIVSAAMDGQKCAEAAFRYLSEKP
jgi:uncharacterized FAD-dependent dehydrogenase